MTTQQTVARARDAEIKIVSRTAPQLSAVVASNTRAECARRGWTQADLAERMRMARGSIADRHRGRVPWTLDEVEQLARLFGIDVLDMLARPKGFEPLTF